MKHCICSVFILAAGLLVVCKADADDCQGRILYRELLKTVPSSAQGKTVSE